MVDEVHEAVSIAVKKRSVDKEEETKIPQKETLRSTATTEHLEHIEGQEGRTSRPRRGRVREGPRRRLRPVHQHD